MDKPVHFSLRRIHVSGRMSEVGEIYDALVDTVNKIKELKSLLWEIENGAGVTLPPRVCSRTEYSKKIQREIVDEYADLVDHIGELIALPFVDDLENDPQLPRQMMDALDDAAQQVLSRPLTPQTYFGYRLVWQEEAKPPRSLQEDINDALARHGLELESFRLVPDKPPTFEEELVALLYRHGVTRGQLSMSNGAITKNSLRS